MIAFSLILLVFAILGAPLFTIIATSAMLGLHREGQAHGDEELTPCTSGQFCELAATVRTRIHGNEPGWLPAPSVGEVKLELMVGEFPEQARGPLEDFRPRLLGMLLLHSRE